jgi:hypothetical protein
MAQQDISFPKPPHSSNWNVVRSRSVPSGVSGTHVAVKPKASLATDESMLNVEEDVFLRARRPLMVDSRANTVVSKN